MIDVIAFDADDTLWHNERYYTQGRERFREIMARYGVDGALEAHIDELEIGNLPHYGYGAMSFVLSLIEASVDLTDGAIRGDDVRALLQMGKEMLSHDVELFPQVEETVAQLAVRHSLMLITKGDLRHQQAKVGESGLAPYFRIVEVVSDKRPQTYARLLERHDIPPARFLMIGNSMRSDILPVLDIGGWAIHVPNSMTWSHETAEPPAEGAARFVEVASIGHVPAAIAALTNAHET